MNNIGATADEVDFPEISDADKSDFEQITLTMHTSQAETFKEAMQLAKKMGDFDQTLNENSNGNAATRVAESFYLGLQIMAQLRLKVAPITAQDANKLIKGCIIQIKLYPIASYIWVFFLTINLKVQCSLAQV